MKTFTAIGSTIKPDTTRRRVSIQLWADGAEAELEMSEAETLQKIADLVNALGAIRRANADPS